MGWIRNACLSALLFSATSILCIQEGWTDEKAKTGSGSASVLPELKIPLLTDTPKIDGVLDDAAWKNPPFQLGDWLTYNPVYGKQMAQRTRVWVAYDKTGLYFAFHCMDPEPDKIKTSISRRDNTYNDDWVGLSLDSLGNHQSSYELFVNANGIQTDVMNSSTKGEDASPDWVWESAAKKTEDGYTAEIRIPFKSIRFASGADVRMAIFFMRRVSRLGVSASWPDFPPGSSFLSRHAPLILHDIKRPLTLEAIPNITYAHDQTLSRPGHWNSDSEPDGGITVKYGVTSAVTLDGTFRPDFSQVESDAFQVEVNQKYPIFYSEKRPFFMEGMGTFDLAGTGGDGNMRTAVHTRRIVDPLYGAKLTGTLGKVTFAALSSADRAPGNTDERNPLYGEKKYFNIARGLYSLGKGTYIGGLITDIELGDKGYNRVAAGDMSLRFGKNHQITSTAIATRTRNYDGNDQRKGMAGQAYYQYSSKRQYFATQFEHYDKDFQMETAFYNRTGITQNWTYYSYNLYPNEARYPWFKKFAPFVWVHAGRDRIQGGNEHFALGGFRMNFTRQGSFRVDYGSGSEAWAGKIFDTNHIQAMGGAQLYRWLNFYVYAISGRSIYYADRINPFSGNSKDIQIQLTFQPTSKFSQAISYERVNFDRASNGEHIYTIDLINTKITYQFNKHLSARAIERYDSSQKRVLMDYLISYEPVPGTVAYAGYGALFEKQDWNGQEFIPGRGQYLNIQRSFFLKLSYLFRL
jgi:hypothetical protein